MNKLKIAPTLQLFLGLSLVLAFSRPLFAEESPEKIDEGSWHSSRSLLVPPPEFPNSSKILTGFRDILVRTFSSVEHANELAKVHAEQGNKARSSIGKTVISFAEKESKLDLIPESFKAGLSFDFGGASSSAPSPVSSSRAAAPRYGLIVTNIEPSSHSLKLASISSSDYELLPYAGKANLEYSVGPIYDDANGFAVPSSPQAGASPSLWSTITAMPAWQFRGKISPKGLPDSRNPLPAQLIKLEQVQGYYTFEAQVSKGIQPESANHRLRVPLYAGAHYSENLDKDFKRVKNSLENIVARGPFSVSLDHYQIEERYQSAFIYQTPGTRLELNTHMSKAALTDEFWPGHRWEMKLERYF